MESLSQEFGGNSSTDRNFSKSYAHAMKIKILEDTEKKYAQICHKISSFFFSAKNEILNEAAVFLKNPTILFEDKDRLFKADPEYLLMLLNNLLESVITYKKKSAEDLKALEGSIKKSQSITSEGFIKDMEQKMQLYIKNEEKLKTLISILEKKLDFFSTRSEHYYAEVQARYNEYELTISNLSEELSKKEQNLQNILDIHHQKLNSSKLERGFENPLNKKSSNNILVNNFNELLRKPSDQSIDFGNEMGRPLSSANIKLKNDIRHAKFFMMKIKDKDKKITLLEDENSKQKQKFEGESLEIKRLKIQIQEKNKEIEFLKVNLNAATEKLRKIHEKDKQEEFRGLAKEALSDKNPHIMEHFKNVLTQKDDEIKQLKRRLKVYTLQEKKIFIKEKAFEMERAEYCNKIVELESINTGLKKALPHQKSLFT